MGTAIVLVGLLPAVCEEACFRGVVLTGLARSGSRTFAVVGSALAFGVFHVNPYHVAAAATLGLVLGYAAYESRSLLPGVLMHFVNNGFQMVMVRMPELQARFESWPLVVLGLLVTGTGLWLLRGSGGQKEEAPPTSRMRNPTEVHP